jgi:hypothetical protein
MLVAYLPRHESLHIAPTMSLLPLVSLKVKV